MDMLTQTAFQTSLFKNVIKFRPVGMGKHFTMLAIHRCMCEDLPDLVDEGEPLQDTSSIWQALEDHYELHEMDAMDIASALEDPTSLISSSSGTTSRNESETLANEANTPQFSLAPLEEADPAFEEMVIGRRQRRSESPQHAGNIPDAGSPLTDASSLSISEQESKPAKRGRKGKAARSPTPAEEVEADQGEDVTMEDEADDDEAEEEEPSEEEASSPAPKSRAKNKRRTSANARGKRKKGSAPNSAARTSETTEPKSSSKLSGAAAISARKRAEREAKEAEEAQPPTPSTATSATGTRKRKR